MKKQLTIADNDSIIKNKIVNHFGDLLPNDSLGIHHGFYERGIRTVTEAELNMNNYVGRLLDLDELNKTEGKVLDAGCGFGGTSIYLAKRYHNIKFVGINLVSRQVYLAKKLAREKGVDSNTEFITGDYCETGLLDNFFDYVFALESACYSIDKKKFIQEVARVLKSNGKFVILDGFVTKKNLPMFLQVAYKYYCDIWLVSDFIILEDFLSNLKSAGFDDFEVKDITNNIFLFHFIWWIKNLAYFPFFTRKIHEPVISSKKQKEEKSYRKNPFIYFIIKVFSPVVIFLSHKFRYLVITGEKKQTV
jgi:ubiquinone/menaquinone biosynthesis C-methylase UbiE